MNVKGPREPIVFIPWIVIEELDFIKSDSNKSSLRHKAQKAVKFIDKTLSNKHQRMRGIRLKHFYYRVCLNKLEPYGKLFHY